MIAYGYLADYIFLGRDFFWVDAASAAVIVDGYLITLFLRCCEIGQRK